MEQSDNKDQIYLWNKEYEEMGDLTEEVTDALQRNACFYPVFHKSREFTYLERHFQKLVADIRGKKVLTVGGGVDKVALYLAAHGNSVVSLDSSVEASKRTLALRDKLGLEKTLEVICADWEKTSLDRQFDLVIIHDSLHHMDHQECVKRVHASLVDGGVFICMEPVCFIDLVRFIHVTVPFHRNPFTPYEAELTKETIAWISGFFKEGKVEYFDFVSRELVAYSLYWLGFRNLVCKIGRIDYLLLKHLPFLRFFASYAILRMTK